MKRKEFDLDNNNSFISKNLLFEGINEGNLKKIEAYIEQELDIHNIYFDVVINNEEIEMSPLDLAIENGNIKIIKYLVETCKVDINELDYNWSSPLLTALEKEQEDIASYLIDMVEDINQVNIDGWSALHFTIFYSYKSLFEKILSKNEIEINLATNDNFTPLHLAIMNDDIYFLNTLIKMGADENVYDEDNETPYQLAQRFNKDSYMEVLDKENTQTPIEEPNDSMMVIEDSTESLSKALGESVDFYYS